jgi:spermidine/putrescine transport system substrate-binding protein
MKKIGILVLTLVMLLSAASLSGCSGAKTPAESPKASGASEASPTVSSTAPKASGELNLYTWEAMFPQDVLDGFTKETGIKINYNDFDLDETMLAKLEASKGGDYDLVIADDYIIKTAISEGLAQKLDTSKLANYGNINPIYQGQFYDPDNAYTVPYGAGVQTIVYNPKTVKIDIKGYADLFDPSLKGSIGTVANYRVIDGLALKVLGKSYNTEDIATINDAGKKLLELAPNIRLIKDDGLENDLLSGEISAAVMYTSQVTNALMADPELKMVFPKEGIGYGIMANFIPSKAPNAAAAYAFIDYILRPEVSAKCFEFLGYYCTNLAAEKMISSDYKQYLTLPESFTGSSMEMIQPISADAEEAHTKIWTEFKSAAGQ